MASSGNATSGPVRVVTTEGAARLCVYTYLPNTAMEWSNDKVIAFLENLQTEPCLWDPKNKGFKNRGTQSDAWRRILEVIPFRTTVEEMKKKKESLMGYYRTHLNKMKKSLKSGAGKDEVYTTKWFAFETMDSFLREIYDGSYRLNTETHDDNDTQEKSEASNDGEVYSQYLYTQTEDDLPIIHEKKEIRLIENKPSVNFARKRQMRGELRQEIKQARRQMEEAVVVMKEKKDDEYEIFGRLIASKLKKMRNPNTRDVLMNDIHNLVFRVCMTDRLEEQGGSD